MSTTTICISTYLVVLAVFLIGWHQTIKRRDREDRCREAVQRLMEVIEFHPVNVIEPRKLI